MSGGVGGRGLATPSYPIFERFQRSCEMHLPRILIVAIIGGKMPEISADPRQIAW